MRWSANELCIGFLFVLLGVLYVPGIGEYVAMILIVLSLPAVVTVQHWFGISNGILAAEIVAASILCLGAFGFIKAFSQRDFAALGILSWGYLAITVLAYFRLGRGW
jgi:hypothetical protein